MMSREQKVKECDATEDEQRSENGQTKNLTRKR
jgi:hypothetical protein